ncbi:hypothetical protein PF010_g17726 [Phytophthora fragariae]|uniref:DUSP domain-containing protein n=1 Tax=Phytophthora fragariae TaxID=53985 RepID=A0A6A3R8F4_9STRA|nr:hypothetical protein PF009_g18665 [Phytophthora fragariae]KAE9092251.1 hypothetical protein PF007_g18586 [Phytophthora fragariae]KAE9092774.1 hypothetical protein PF010_g17726 [Phytophthora fragariae]KAE9206476.1 hypothetical protein PF004_g17284 [Phytophthora fragariae]
MLTGMSAWPQVCPAAPDRQVQRRPFTEAPRIQSPTSMTKQATEHPSCSDGDDWLVVGCDDSGRVPTAGGSPRPKASNESRGLEASQPQNQIEEQDAAPESDLNQKDNSFYQLLVWHNGLNAPVELVGENHKPLVVAASASSSAADLQKMLQELVLVHPQLRIEFPQVERENVSDVLQMCRRSDEKDAWVPLAESDAEGTADPSGVKLQLTSQINLSSGKQWSQLLVESKFEAASCSDELTAWRRGRFFSDIQANAWRFELQIGQLVDALDTDKRWYESRIVDMDAVYVKVHYRGWTSKWDEWLRRTSARLAPLHTKVSTWRAFQVGDRVMVGTEVPGKKYPEWRNAEVTACDDEGGSLQIEVDVDGKKKWLDAQDELLCPTGTHKAVNADPSVASAVLAAPILLFDYFERPGDPPSSDDQPAHEVESIRQAMHGMHLAASDGDGDEWCVVNDDHDKDGVEAEADAGNNNAEEAVVEAEATVSEGSCSCDSDSDCSATSKDAQSVNNVAVPTLDQTLPTTTEVLLGQMEATISEEDDWRYDLQVDQLIDSRDTDNVWYESRVVALSSTLVKVHYRGWTSKWDEWIERTSTRIAPLHTKVRNWRDFKVGNPVMVGRQVVTKKYPEWRNAVITACEACEVDGRLRIEVDIDGSKKWMDAQDEMLCPPGTHKAVNSSMLKHMAPLF